MDNLDKPGVLYIVSTPIGNLEDITLRALRILKEVDLIAAEDTRETKKLLNHYNISTSLTSYHEHNKIKKGTYLIDLLKKGINIALVSDAGTPGISDPGEHLIQIALKENIPLIPIPGPTALITGLVVSGLPTATFLFQGFLPPKRKKRREALAKLREREETIILYEAPHRLLETLEDIQEIIGDRSLVVARELTKRFEEIFRGTVTGALTRFKEVRPRGELVIYLSGGKKEVLSPWRGLSIAEHIKMVMERDGVDKNTAIKMVAKERGIPKREVYKMGIDLKLED